MPRRNPGDVDRDAGAPAHERVDEVHDATAARVVGHRINADERAPHVRRAVYKKRDEN